MWQAVVTDLNGLTRAFAQDYDAISLTPNLNGYREAALTIDPLDDASNELVVAARALKLYDSAGALQFFGKVWEPLERTSDGVKVLARGPLAEFSWRRVRAQTLYTTTNGPGGGPWDAGLIVADRIAVQNGYRNTYLTMGSRQASANRIRTYEPGLLESDLLDELANAAGGFFYLEQPVDNTPGVMAQVNVLYPAAGVSREDVRFEYGIGTIDNCSDYKVVTSLPRTRQVVSSTDSFGNRITGVAEDAGAIATYGLFEDEETYSDVVDYVLLQQQAQGGLRLTPPTTIEMTPGLEAPVLFRDFNVGDFVRVNIVHGNYRFYSWARVANATLSVDNSGIETTSGITLELLTGGSPLGDPELAFYDQIDSLRQRLEALTRSVQAATAPASPQPPSGDPSYQPPPDPAPPVEQPIAPDTPPVIRSFSAVGVWVAGSTPTGVFTFDVDPGGVDTNAYVVVTGGRQTQVVDVGTAEKTLTLSLAGLTRNTAYTATLHAVSANGEVTATANFTTPSLQVS